MNHDSNISPVDWYVGTYQIRFVELAHTGNNDPERKFLTWENTVLVRATSLGEAYDKVAAIGREHTEPYKGGPDGMDVQWLFEGVIELLPVYADLEDGAEIMWAERTRTLKNIRGRARCKEQFFQNRLKLQQSAPTNVAKQCNQDSSAKP